MVPTVPPLRRGRRYRRRVPSDGILSDPIDLDGPRRPSMEYRLVEARPGLVVEHRASGVVGSIRSFNDQLVTLRDRHDQDRPLRTQPGGFLLDGVPCTLVAPPPVRPTEPVRTASGSISRGPAPARVARGSRILVEGIHDAELVEKVWGDDLRVEGVVVEHLGGMDDLEMIVRQFGPAPRRRLGVLLDHLVEGTKERRVASRIDHPDVLITGHPYVDIWQAVKPSVVGLERWPVIPKGQDWKEGVCEAIGWRDSTAAFWKHLRGKVQSYTDLEPGLIGAVEQLIDFVAPPE